MTFPRGMTTSCLSPWGPSLRAVPSRPRSWSAPAAGVTSSGGVLRSAEIWHDSQRHPVSISVTVVRGNMNCFNYCVVYNFIYQCCRLRRKRAEPVIRLVTSLLANQHMASKSEICVNVIHVCGSRNLIDFITIYTIILLNSVCLFSQTTGRNSCSIVSGDISNCSYRLTVHPVTSSHLSSP